MPIAEDILRTRALFVTRREQLDASVVRSDKRAEDVGGERSSDEPAIRALFVERRRQVDASIAELDQLLTRLGIRLCGQYEDTRVGGGD